MTSQPDEPLTSPPTSFALALQVVTGDLPPASYIAFESLSTLASGGIDKRVVLQTDIWVDRRTHVHQLDQMTPDNRATVLAFLQHEATRWIDTALVWELAAAVSGIIPGRVASEQVELLDLLTPGWTDHTPLGRRLHALNDTRPHPIAPPRGRVTADESDHPEILRDADVGRWKVTTESGAIYRVDLDQRRVLRQPRLRSPSNGHHLHEPGKRLPHDHAWAALDCLIRCRTGNGLILTERRPHPQLPEGWAVPSEEGAADGTLSYRISTDILDIRRAAGPIRTAVAAGDD